MSFEYQIFGGDKGHHSKSHQDAGHKLHDEAHKLFDKLHHGLEKATPIMHKVEEHAKPIIHQVGHEAERQAKPYVRAAQHEIHGTATPAEKHRLETVGKVAATVFLPHVVIGSEIAKKGIQAIQHSNITTNVHLDQHVKVNHGESKQ